MSKKENEVIYPAYWYKRTQLFIKDEMIPQCGYQEVRIYLVLPNDSNVDDPNIIDVNIWIEYVLPNQTVVKPDMTKFEDNAINYIVSLLTTLDYPIKKDSKIKEIEEEDSAMNRYIVAKGLIYWTLYDLFLMSNGKEVKKGKEYVIKTDAIIQHHTVTTTAYDEEIEANEEENKE